MNGPKSWTPLTEYLSLRKAEHLYHSSWYFEQLNTSLKVAGIPKPIPKRNLNHSADLYTAEYKDARLHRRVMVNGWATVSKDRVTNNPHLFTWLLCITVITSQIIYRRITCSTSWLRKFGRGNEKPYVTYVGLLTHSVSWLWSCRSHFSVATVLG